VAVDDFGHGQIVGFVFRTRGRNTCVLVDKSCRPTVTATQMIGNNCDELATKWTLSGVSATQLRSVTNLWTTVLTLSVLSETMLH
jgi:hypothetical protein